MFIASSLTLPILTGLDKVTDLVRVSCEDGRDFIRSCVSKVYDDPFPAYTGPRLSRVQEERERKRLQKLAAQGQPLPSPTTADTTQPPRRRISHFVMNLPDSAIQFLDAFRGILVDDSDTGRDLGAVYDEMPMVHCHCFTRELDPEKAELDIREVRLSPLRECSERSLMHLKNRE